LVPGGVRAAGAEGGVIGVVGRGRGERAGRPADAQDGAAQGIAGAVELVGEAGHSSSGNALHLRHRFGVWLPVAGKEGCRSTKPAQRPGASGFYSRNREPMMRSCWKAQHMIRLFGI
jgi:hypothetical protein